MMILAGLFHHPALISKHHARALSGSVSSQNLGMGVFHRKDGQALESATQGDGGVTISGKLQEASGCGAWSYSLGVAVVGEG